MHFSGRVRKNIVATPPPQHQVSAILVKKNLAIVSLRQHPFQCYLRQATLRFGIAPTDIPVNPGEPNLLEIFGPCRRGDGRWKRR